MSQTIPKLSELQGVIKTSLAEATLFVAASVGCKADKTTKEKSVVVQSDGTNEKIIEQRRRERGICIIVAPILFGRQRDQSGPVWILDADIMVKVSVNVERNSSDDGANVSIYAAIVAVIETLCGRVRHPGGEFFRLAEDAFELSRFDEGLWEYNVMFHKEILL